MENLKNASRICDKIAGATKRLLERRLGITLAEAQQKKREMAKYIVGKCQRIAIVQSIDDVTPQMTLDADLSYEWVVYNALKSLLAAYSEMSSAKVWLLGLRRDDFN